MGWDFHIGATFSAPITVPSLDIGSTHNNWDYGYRPNYNTTNNYNLYLPDPHCDPHTQYMKFEWAGDKIDSIKCVDK